eukprot:g82509.t1
MEPFHFFLFDVMFTLVCASQALLMLTGRMQTLVFVSCAVHAVVIVFNDYQGGGFNLPILPGEINLAIDAWLALLFCATHIYSGAKVLGTKID